MKKFAESILRIILSVIVALVFCAILWFICYVLEISAGYVRGLIETLWGFIKNNAMVAIIVALVAIVASVGVDAVLRSLRRK